MIRRPTKIGTLAWLLLLSIPAATCVTVTLAETKSAAPRRSDYTGPRTPDGKPNMNGIWQVMNSANWDLRAHSAGQPPIAALGAVGARTPGLSVVIGNEIPYLADAVSKQQENAANWLALDPEAKCYLPGVPRATYLPYPFQIVQTSKNILFAYQFDSASRMVPITDKKLTNPVDTWMGVSTGHWDGDVLVVDVSSFNDKTWFDRSGDYHSDELHVVERYAPISRDIIMYEATIEDKKVFSRPWKISMPIYRHVEKNAQMLEFKCVEFAEEMMYGHLRKRDTK